ncbi:toll/interleukin-1 receptor domain-containing protein [Acinetobacter bohemicus]|uniref:TIR domain-containing protein n=1 Tax=Acinetobacter bohemicus TaxID=1435036 RepID=A0A1I6VDN5_9GAMM|nr:toll/interleukin-1 receptor domain-containing protein [Acinetobacter bohemicus]KAB0651481.1 toll/interleukin-1 receptor domain-containing protein [Acinetobacter bohemicus]SFT11730.1 TIR domain-containing protein [Acinetobacter bohemicus]
MQENYEEKIKLIHNILIAVSTGTNITPILNQNYSQFRNELLSSKYKDVLPIYVKSSLDLKQFWSVIKNESQTYQGRRDILNSDFLKLESLSTHNFSEKYHLKILTKSKKKFYKCNMTFDELQKVVNSYHYAEDMVIQGNTILASDIESISLKESVKDFEIFEREARVELDNKREQDSNNGLFIVGGYDAKSYAFSKLKNVTDKFIVYPLDALRVKEPPAPSVENKGNALKKIFISHATKDKEIIEELIDLLENIGINSAQIFCSSFEGYGIPLGENFLDKIKQELSSEVLVLFVITKNFYDSKVCLCEMGAAWALSKGHIPIVVPPLSYSDIQGVIPLTQGLLINDVPKLNSLKEKLEEIFEIEGKISLNTWERKRKKFITSLNEFI